MGQIKIDFVHYNLLDLYIRDLGDYLHVLFINLGQWCFEVNLLLLSLYF